MSIYLILVKASIPGLFPAPPLKRLYGDARSELRKYGCLLPERNLSCDDSTRISEDLIC
jgi:hypothetical protein